MEVGIVGGMALGSIAWRATVDYRLNRKDMLAMAKKWNECVYASGLYNKEKIVKGGLYETFNVVEIDRLKAGNGYKLKINIPANKSLSDLESKREVLENNLNVIVELSKDRFKAYVEAILITSINNYPFAPVKAYDNQLWIGKQLNGSDYLLDINRNSHVLISGMTGTGKTFLLASIIANLVHNSSKYIELILCQISKSEINFLAKLKPVKFSANTLKETDLILKKLVQKINLRSEQHTSRGVRNISHWNSKFPKKKMKRIYCVIEELSAYMPNDTDSDDDKEIKGRCWSNILDIVKYGRSAGIHLIGITQRTTVSNLGGNGDVKSQLTMITFRQKNAIDSNSAIGTNEACKLEEQEVIVDGTDGFIYCKTPYVDEDFKILHKYVPEIIVPEEKKEEVISFKKFTKHVIDYSNDGKCKELPLYIPKKVEKTEENPIEKDIEVIDIKEVATTKVLRKRKGMIEE